MSTRGWYELYVVDDARREVSRAMQWYKWGDATPENALYERDLLASTFAELNNRPPVHLVDDLLRDNVGEAFAVLPPAFPLGCYCFFLLRAAEERASAPFRSADWIRLPKEQRPDYRLGFAVGKATVLQGYEIPRTGNATIDGAHFAIEVGRLVRRWVDHSADMTFLRWLQYLTQVTTEIDMGSIAGDFEAPRFDVSYHYNLFVRVPALDARTQHVTDVTIDLRTPAGADLLDDIDAQLAEATRDDDRAYLERERARITRLADAARPHLTTLDALRETHTLVPSPFWARQIPRLQYLGP